MRLNLTVEKALLRPLIPQSWTDKLGLGEFGVGHDQATTEKNTSNPASIVVTEKLGRLLSVRLALRFKSAEYRVRLAAVELVIDDIEAAKKRARRVIIDATSERAQAGMLRDQLAGRVPVEFFISSESIEVRGQKVSRGNQAMAEFVQTFEDNVTALPAEGDEGGGWLYHDLRLVKNYRGGFLIEEDSAGNHGDCAIAASLAQLALTSGAAGVEATPADIADSVFRERGNPLSAMIPAAPPALAI